MYSSMENIIDQFNNSGSHWFKRGTRRWWSCRVLAATFCALPDGRALFITSDRDARNGRSYSVRLASWFTDDDGRTRPTMETPRFQTASTRAAAIRQLREVRDELAPAAAAFGSGTPSLVEVA